MSASAMVRPRRRRMPPLLVLAAVLVSATGCTATDPAPTVAGGSEYSSSFTENEQRFVDEFRGVLGFPSSAESIASGTSTDRAGRIDRDLLRAAVDICRADRDPGDSDVRPQLMDALDDDLGNQFTQTQVSDAFDLIVDFCAVN